MNSRFKFRVWDKKDKEYLDPDYYEGFYMSPDGVVHAGITEYNGICDKYQEIPQKQLIIEQCTGLKDKNGKLIFEGDIVKTAIGEIGVVVFFDAQFAVRFENAFYCSVAEAKEIISNIHEDQFRDLTELMESKVKE